MEFPDLPYRDALLSYFLRLDTLSEETDYYNVHALFGEQDTLLCHLYKEVKFRTMMLGGKKVAGVEVESRISPYASLNASVEGLTETELASLIDDMKNQPSRYPYLMGAPQTCLSYSLECLLRTHHINPEPICYRRSMYPQMQQVDAFLKEFCNEIDQIPAKKRDVKKYVFPANSLLIFRTKQGEIIHGVFYDGQFVYTKNGITAYMVYRNILPLLDSYGYYGSEASHLDKATKDSSKAVHISVYTLKTDKFKL